MIVVLPGKKINGYAPCVQQICVQQSLILDICLIKSDIMETEKPLTEIKGLLSVGVERFELPTSSL